MFLNFFGAEQIGKTPIAARIYYELTALNINAGLIQEYAKEKIWLGDEPGQVCQPYITAKQLYRQYRANGRMDVAIIDTPILTGVIYPGFGCSGAWEQATVEQFFLFNNLNILLTSDEEISVFKKKLETAESGKKIRDILVKYNVPHHVVDISDLDMATFTILEMIQDRLEINGLNVKVFRLVDKDGTLISIHQDIEQAFAASLSYYSTKGEQGYIEEGFIPTSLIDKVLTG